MLAPDKKPKEIDLVFAGQTTGKAIYDISGDELRFCFTQDNGERPTEFKGNPAKTQVFATFKREMDPAKVKAYKDAFEKAHGSSSAATRSANNLRQIGIGIHNYAVQHGHLPPAAIYSKDGKPLLSWRVLILPFIEQDALARHFHMDEPWDSEHNKTLAQMVIPTYAPVAGTDGVKEKNFTYYRVFTGPGTLFEGTKKITFADIPDGAANTILAVEADEPVIWTKPDELPYDPQKPLPKLGGLFKGSFNLLRADGGVQFVKPGFDEALFRLGVTRNDGKVIDLSKLNK